MDFGGTLDADGRPWADRFLALYRSAGGGASTETFYDAFATSDRALLDMPGIEECNYTETVALQVELLAAIHADGARLRAAGATRRFVDDARCIAARNRPVLEGLRPYFQLGVVSNYQGNLRPCLDELGLADLFDAISDSRLVGVRKPDRAIFDLTLAELDCDPVTSWMVGDNPGTDIEPAAAIGMATCWIAPPGRTDSAVVPTARVARFDAIPSLVVV